MKDMMDNNVKRGDMRFYKEQPFHCVGFKVRERRDGTELWLIRWESLCLKCVKRFEFATPAHVDEVYPLRTCKAHRRAQIKRRRKA